MAENYKKANKKNAMEPEKPKPETEDGKELDP
jgi:hypothetical protein